MRKSLKIMLLLLCALLMMAGFVSAPLGAEVYDATVYVDAAKGLDTNDGLTEATAVQTLTAAYSNLLTQMNAAGKNSAAYTGRMVLVSDYTHNVSGTKDIVSSTYAHAYMLVITGKTADVSLQFHQTGQSYVGLIGPTTFQNVGVKLADSATVAYLSLHSRGSKLIIGEGVTGGATFSKCLSLDAGTYYKRTGDTYLEVNSGKWRNLYAGGYSQSLTGKGTLVINGGECEKIATTFNGTRSGDTDITINGGTVGQVQGGNINANGSVTGNVTITMTGGTVTTAFSASGIEAVTGNITLNLTGGTVKCAITADCTGTYTANMGGKELSLLGGGDLTANTFTGGGRLTLGSQTALTISDSVTGTTAVTLSGEPTYGNAYITAPAATADTAFTFDGAELTPVVSGTTKVWQCTDTAYTKGLVLTAPVGVTVKLYTGLAKGATTLVTPDFSETKDGIVSYYYLGLAAGNYHYLSSGTGYFTVDKDIYFTEAKASTQTVVVADPGKKSGNYFEAVTNVLAPTDEFLEKVTPSDVSLWPDYAEALTTPMFTDAPRATHQYTTYDEMVAVLKELAEQPNVYLYSLGKTGLYEQDIPLLIYTTTDLSGAKTLEEAAALVRGNEKLTVYYQGLMHGNEPAGGEGTLGVAKLLAGDYGQGLIDTMNLCVIPWLSPDGAKDDRRLIPGTSIDPNRDMLRVETEEIRLHHLAYELFQPEVSMDSHEFTVDPSYESTSYNDMMLAAGFTTNNSETFRELSIHLTTLPFEKLREQGLRCTYYLDNANFNNPNNGSSYAGNRGILYVLIESRGIYGGQYTYARRTVGHVITATEVLNYVHENVEMVQKTVDEEKSRIATIGATYEEDDIIVLEHGNVSHEELSYVKPRYNGATGELMSEPVTIPKISEEVVRSRVKPTAYVIPAGESWTQRVLDRLDKHFVEYTYIPAGQAMWLQQYGGTTKDATLSAEQVFTFPNGAYAVTMDTYYSVVIATLFEPDVTDSYEYLGTLCQSGLIPTEGNSFPLYRYIRDLNEDGTITTFTPDAAPVGLVGVNPEKPGDSGAVTGLDSAKLYEYRHASDTGYTPVAAGSSEISGLGIGTYYIRYQAPEGGNPSKDTALTLFFETIDRYAVYLSPNGDDTAEGYTAQEAVATVAMAYSRLEQLMSFAPEGTSGYVVLTADYALGNSAFSFPAHTFPVVITATSPTIALTKGGTGAQTDCAVNLNGPTTFEHMTLTIVSTGAYNNFNCNGYKTVMGEGLTCNPNSKGAYFMLAAGGDRAVASTDLTVLAGTWKNIYAGGYTGQVNGDARVVAENCTVTDQIQNSYNANTTGNVTLSLKNVTTTTVYCGNANKNGVGGNVNLTIGEGCAITNVYAGSRDAGDVTGTVTITLDGANTADFTVLSGKAKNSTGTVGKSVLVFADGVVTTVPTTFTECRIDTSSGGTVTLQSNVSVASVTGGGTIVLPAGGKLTTEALSGITRLTLTEAAAGDVVVDSATNTGSFIPSSGSLVVTAEGDRYLWTLEESKVFVYAGKTLVGTYSTFVEAAEVAATTENAFIRLGSHVRENATIPGGLLVDLAGFDLSGITVDGTIYGMDSTTDGYEGGSVGKLTLAGGTVATDVKTTVAQIGAIRRYLAIPEGDGYTFHRFYFGITHIALNPAAGGMGYKATFAGDEAVRNYVDGFGMKLALSEDFAGATTATFTDFDGKILTKTVLLEGIFKAGLTDAELTERATMAIYAATFLTTADGVTITSSVMENSLQTMVEAIDSNWAYISTTDKKRLKDFYTAYEAILSKWNTPNMGS